MDICKLLKISTGENILCKVDTENVFEESLVTISEPIVINIVRMPTSRGTVETCVMYPWSVFTIDNIFELSTSQIVAVANPSVSVKKYYINYLAGLNESNNLSESSVSFDSDDSESLQELQEDFINEDLDDDENDSTERGKRVYH